tara:strand:- start:335 stop:1186 length:852 start_codon:yes stop_codon:yes gene_type:complete
MGNYLSSGKHTLNTIGDFKITLGSCDEPVYSNENIPEDLLGLFENSPVSNMINRVTVPSNDRGLLNRFLVSVHNHLKENFNSESPFAEKCENANLLLSSLLNEEGITDESLELIGSNVESVDKSKVKTVKTFRCVYKFPEETLRMYDNVQLVSIDNVKVGLKDNNLVLFSPSVKPEETTRIYVKWNVYELEEDEVYVIPIDIEGVQVENGKVVRHNLDNLELLIEASNLLKENDDRLLKSKLDQFNSWKETSLKNREVYALVGGVEKGNLQPLTEFFEKMEIF